MIVIFTSMTVFCHQIHQKSVIRIFTMVTVTPCLSVAQDFRSSSSVDRPLISLRIPVVSVADASSRSPAADIAVLVAEVLNLSQASPRLVQPAPSLCLFSLMEAKNRVEGAFPSSPGPLSHHTLSSPCKSQFPRLLLPRLACRCPLLVCKPSSGSKPRRCPLLGCIS